MTYKEFEMTVGEEVFKKFEHNMLTQMDRNLRLFLQYGLDDMSSGVVEDIEERMKKKVEHYKNVERVSVVDFLNSAFVWAETSEGQEFWANVWKKSIGMFLDDKESALLFDVTWFPPAVANLDGDLLDHVEWKNQSLHQVIMMIRKQDYKGIEIVQAKG